MTSWSKSITQHVRCANVTDASFVGCCRQPSVLWLFSWPFFSPLLFCPQRHHVNVLHVRATTNYLCTVSHVIKLAPRDQLSWPSRYLLWLVVIQGCSLSRLNNELSHDSYNQYNYIAQDDAVTSPVSWQLVVMHSSSDQHFVPALHAPSRQTRYPLAAHTSHPDA